MNKMDAGVDPVEINIGLENYYKQSIAMHPNYGVAHYNMGVVFYGISSITKPMTY